MDQTSSFAELRSRLEAARDVLGRPEGRTWASATVLTVDAAPTTGIDAFIDAMAQMEAAGATPTGIFANPLDWAALAKVKESTGSNKPVLVTQSGPTLAATRSLNGLPVEVSSGCPAGTAYVVDGTRTVAVVRKDGSVEADRSVGFRNDITVVRVVGRFAFGYLYPAAVARIKDVVLGGRRGAHDGIGLVIFGPMQAFRPWSGGPRSAICRRWVPQRLC